VGKGTIVGEIGEGLYTLSLDYGSDAISQKIANLQARESEIEAAIADLQSDLLSAAADSRAERDALDAAIATWNNNQTDDNRSIVDKATSAAIEARGPEKKIEKDLAWNRLELSNVRRQIGVLESEQITKTEQCWCADYTIDVSGTVATVEINGEGQETLVSPGAPPSAASDGSMTDVLAVSGAAAYLNAAILPGWQKFSPTYRVGTISEIDRENDLCSVSLDSASSTAQNLNINQSDNLSSVPIEYMTCNSAAFEDGDQVVVRFENQDWEQPKVIGFRSNPRPCGPTRIILPVELVETVNTTYYPTAKVAASIMEIDVQHTPCIGGQYQTRETSPRPPGYRSAGQVQNAINSIVTLRPHFSSLGIYASNSRRGGKGGFAFNEDYTISGVAPTFSNQLPDGALTTIFAPRSLSGFQFQDVTNITLKNADTTIDQYEALIYNVSFVTADIEENDATVQCVNDFMSTRMTGVPSTITVTPAGGGSIVYEFYRYFEGLDGTIPGYTDMPTTFAGMGLGYRLRE